MTGSKMLFAGIRFAIAGLIVLSVARSSGRSFQTSRRIDWRFILAFALMNTTLHYFFFYVGMSHSEGSRAAILNSLSTFLVVLLACACFKSDRLTSRKILGCTVGFCGILALNLGGAESGQFTWLGDGMIILNAICGACANLMTRGLSRRIDIFVGTGYSLSIGGLLLIISGLVFGGTLPQINMLGIICLILLIAISALGFALYNKWTGQMRIWTYVANPKGWGSDWMLNIYFGKSEYDGGPGEVMYPLYHVFEYGIPTCHKPNTSLYMSARLVDKQTQTFQTWLSPYKMNSSINAGWHCFEFDMSGYVPEGSVWLDKGEYSIPFKIYPETINETKVTLNGALIGSAKGSFESDRIIQQGGANAASGIMSSLGNGLKAIGGMGIGHITTSSAYANLMANGGDEGIGAYLNPIARWGGFACNVAGLT